MTLLERGKHQFDIRAVDAVNFRLTSHFTIFYEQNRRDGTYMEWWVSSNQWQTETISGDFRRLEIVQGNKRWLLDNASPEPSRVNEAARTLNSQNLYPELLKAATFRDRTFDGVPVRCVETNALGRDGKSAFCFDKSTGDLVVEVTPLGVRNKIVDRSCQFTNYQKFGDKSFPRLVRCFDDGKLKLQIQIDGLSGLESSKEPFLKPEGAVESFHCEGSLKPPQSLSAPDPELPKRMTPEFPVILRLTVARDGKTQDINVEQSIDKDFDGAAVRAVRRWKFAPARCDGVPIDSEIHVEVSFRAY